MQSVVIAYSGGLDSTFILNVAIDALGRDNVLAVTARSETYPKSEYNNAKETAKKLGAKHLTIKTRELALKKFRDNPVNRCYYCKRELFKRLDAIRREMDMGYVLDGTNYDDLKDIRYGRYAAREIGIKSPLVEAKIDKADIRRLSRRLNLPTWDKPSSACLASRIPVNVRIEKSMLARIERAEDYLRTLGIKQVRARVYKDMVRIETYKEDIPKVLRARSAIAEHLKKLGFRYVTLDLEGYRTGSMMTNRPKSDSHF